MKPTWQTSDGSIRLYLGDCLDVLPTLEAGSVDAVVTDPPFGIDYGGYESHDDSREAYERLITAAVLGSVVATKQGGLLFWWQGMGRSNDWHRWFPNGYRIFAALKNFTQHLPTPVQYSWDPVIWWVNGKTDRKAPC